MVLGVVYKVDPRAIREDLSHAWYADRGAPRPPDQGETVPDREKEGAYSWVKIIGAHCLNAVMLLPSTACWGAVRPELSIWSSRKR
ncbi:hypothetical protein IT084_05435 [Desulfallas sp. Bu1-1]|uniref:nickel-dependent hydrogenase large subunit n=1 Tax=Desulfallas sp. Bu1-1 TaxID=2787620 RepID=UPI00189F0968|nr:nickel-dependent hydrogenase large subunit [Desulfallas sp. Bu1-1]MBF7082421.1 hypothetical protein [Desulfallas sp. Bu1-1]